ncbi:MAG: hypothetical protein KBT11_04300 [Treponema sp.]|nr:hypothetical protein [Candidatus Treponema equifaecale]
MVSASMFFAGCSEEEESEPVYKAYRVSEIPNYEGDETDSSPLQEPDTAIVFHYTIEEAVLPFYSYTMEIRNDSKNGKVAKKITFLGEDIEDSAKYEECLLGAIQNTKQSDIPEYGKHDLYYVLTKVEKPVLTFKFNVAEAVTNNIPNGYTAVFVAPDGYAIEANKTYELSDYSSDVFKRIPILMQFTIVKERLLKDHVLTLPDPENYDKTDILSGYTFDISINGKTIADEDSCNIKLQDFEIFGKEKLGKDKTVTIEITSFKKE